MLYFYVALLTVTSLTIVPGVTYSLAVGGVDNDKGRLTVEEPSLLSTTSSAPFKNKPESSSNETGIITRSTCPPVFDMLLHWPEIPAGSIAQQLCSTIVPEASGYATRKCFADGFWDKTDYSICMKFVNATLQEIDESDAKWKTAMIVQGTVSYIYLSGFAISNLSMLAAIAIFVKFQLFKCLRNLIHCQLLIAMTMKNFMWILMYILLHNSETFRQQVNCTILMGVHKFFLYATFSWMFVEGLYLFVVIVKAFMSSQLKMRHCAAIGWGIPVVTTLLWVALKLLYQPDGVMEKKSHCWEYTNLTVPANFSEVAVVSTMLLVNAFFMAAVIYTLVRKLQQTVLNERRKYRKAVRAMVILLPLLGGAYILLYAKLTSPDDTIGEQIWSYINALVQSTQGFVVALVYCFLNKEVKSSIKKLHRRWKDEKSLPSLPGQWWTNRRRSSATTTTTTRREDIDYSDTCSSSLPNSRRVSDELIKQPISSHLLLKYSNTTQPTQ